jgi:hypothetical protein
MSALVDESTLKVEAKTKEEDPNVENDDVRNSYILTQQFDVNYSVVLIVLV